MKNKDIIKQLTDKQLSEYLDQSKDIINKLNQKNKIISIGLDKYELSLMDILNDERIMNVPELKYKAIDLKSQVIPLLHIGEINSVHNHKYREEILEKEFDINKPYLNNTKINNSMNGTDIKKEGIEKPNVELKSMTINNDDSYLYINRTTRIGEIDKIRTKASGQHDIYKQDTTHHLFCGIFNSNGSELIMTIYVNNVDFGKVVSNELSNRIKEYNEKTIDGTKAGRDSLVLNIGMFLKCESLKIISINKKWTDKIIFTLYGENENLTQSINGKIKDKTNEINNILKTKKINNKCDIILLSHASYNFNSFKLYDFTVLEIYNFSKKFKSIDDLNSSKYNIYSGYYDGNTLVALFEISCNDWKNIALEQYKYLISDVENINIQPDLKRSNVFRLKSSQIRNSKLIYFNTDYKERISYNRCVDTSIDCLEEIIKISEGNNYQEPTTKKKRNKP